MPPAEDAALLLVIVQRHLVALQLGLDGVFPEEEWGFLAQQALEKLLKAQIVLANQRPPRSHDLAELADLAGSDLPADLLDLQVFAVEARYEEGPFPLPASREVLLGWLQALLEEKEAAVRRARES
ncbi:HEPN domain-containing protein [Cyanobium sp. Morenito 9A2]|uniref:HEPN domain-containing protein n=1 Tax=Cyanobium sp. Morenito 9A2 TaxID=2823718 RepID=UPI0020CDF1AE|nr:HEPN domain-containing protein [Cyanobium sp. Morenito 9A2]MCP9849799.1 HEPN domain-containing protein [Cyanobium sp. Morenito 9A2]